VGGEKVFVTAKCGACHGGPNFTVSRVEYTPGPDNNGSLPNVSPPPGELATMLPSLLGKLRTVTYDVPSALLSLHPPAKSGPPTLRRWSPGSADPLTYAYAPSTAINDQINCVLRDVGTFPSQEAKTNFIGVSPRGGVSVIEVRQDMKTLAVGETGFNIPSLVGLSVGAPYFHAGNARTLEEALDTAFQKHHQALAPEFLGDSAQRQEQIAALVAYLLSIDDGTPVPFVGIDFNPDLCAGAREPIK
jgi:hypothetical protein